MGKHANRGLRADARGLKQRFQAWRQSCRRGMGRIPNWIWTEAVDLALKHGAGEVADYVGLNPDHLEEQVAERLEAAEPPATAGDLQDASPFSEAGAPRPTFLELPLPQVPASSGCTVEAEDRKGNRVKVELSGEATNQAAAVARALWEGQA